MSKPRYKLVNRAPRVGDYVAKSRKANIRLKIASVKDLKGASPSIHAVPPALALFGWGRKIYITLERLS